MRLASSAPRARMGVGEIIGAILVVSIAAFILAIVAGLAYTSVSGGATRPILITLDARYTEGGLTSVSMRLLNPLSTDSTCTIYIYSVYGPANWVLNETISITLRPGETVNPRIVLPGNPPPVILASTFCRQASAVSAMYYVAPVR